MTIDEFNRYLQTLPLIEDQIVYLRYKYDWEDEWTYSNEILEVDMNVENFYCWLKDWNEGQQDIEILGCIAVSDINVPSFDSDEKYGVSKAQVQVEPTWRRGIPFCGKCGRQFGHGFKYCPDCGMAVKWE